MRAIERAAECLGASKDQVNGTVQDMLRDYQAAPEKFDRLLKWIPEYELNAFVAWAKDQPPAGLPWDKSKAGS
jgi:hypothetical protein